MESHWKVAKARVKRSYSRDIQLWGLSLIEVSLFLQEIEAECETLETKFLKFIQESTFLLSESVSDVKVVRHRSSLSSDG